MDDAGAPRATVERVTSVDVLWACAALIDPDRRRCIDYALGPVFRGCGIVVCARTHDDRVVGLIWGQWTQDPLTLFVPYVTVAPGYRGRSLVAEMDSVLGTCAVDAGRRYAFGLANIDNDASNRAIEKSGYHRVHAARRFYYPDAKGYFYFKDRLDAASRTPPPDSSFWTAVLRQEPLL